MRLNQARQESAQADIATEVNEEIERVEARLEATPAGRRAAGSRSLEREQLTPDRVSFNDYSAKRLDASEANVQVDLERRQLGEQFRILESGLTRPSRPGCSPNRPLIMVLGIDARDHAIGRGRRASCSKLEPTPRTTSSRETCRTQSRASRFWRSIPEDRAGVRIASRSAGAG